MKQDETGYPLKTWVVFSGHADMAWLKILKPGFRHCSVLLHDGDRWISYDPLSNYTAITVHQLPAEFNLPLWMQERGHTVLPVDRSFPPKPAPVAFFSCVSAVKRVLGLHKRFIITPWQLYRYLTQKQGSHFNPTHQGVIAWEV
jgi:hypothetical protein